MSQIPNSRILITGGAKGIGRLLALKMAHLGAEVVVWDIDQGGMDKLVAESRTLPNPIKAYRCDLSKKAEIEQVAAQVKEDLGPIQILVNNAGIVSGKGFTECSDAQIERTMDINIMALFWTTRAFLPAMMEADCGHIVTLSSAGGVLGTCGLVDYSASKFAAFGFDESLRMELRKRRSQVRTTVVCPYFIDTGMFHGVKTRFPLLLPILKEEYVANRILGAIQKNKKRLLMPRMVYTVPLLRLFPIGILDAVADFLGINASMDAFTGRQSESQPPQPQKRSPKAQQQNKSDMESSS